jgi:hypothetical protein
MRKANGAVLASGSLVYLSAFRQDLTHHLFKRSCGVYCHAAARYCFSRLMQSSNDFPFRWFCAPVSWVQCYSFINPPVQGVKVNLKDKNAVKQIDEL